MDLQHSLTSRRNLIEASAGTGKTWTLSALYVRLLLERRLSVREILVVTYTKAATAELRQRIRAKLAELLALYQGQPSSDEFLSALYLRFADEDSQRRVLLAVHGFDEAAIFTIHGFCQRALQEAAFEAACDFDNALQSDDSELARALLTDLWRKQLAAAKGRWALWLVQKKVTPDSLWKTLQSYLGKPWLHLLPAPALPCPAPDEGHLPALFQNARALWQAQGEAFMESVHAHGKLNANSYKPEKFPLWAADISHWLEGGQTLLDPPLALMKFSASALAKGTHKDATAPCGALPDALEALNGAIERTLAHFAQQLAALYSYLLDALNQELPKRKAAQRLLAFDDLLGQLQRALASKSGEVLAVRLRTQYPLALIDEFQDTDPLQWAIFDRIYPLAEDSGQGALCMVGDPKQAIYAFRGADLATYLNARQSAQERHALPNNYRSSPQLIEALNALFDHPLPFAQQGLNYPRVNAAEKARKTLVLPENLSQSALNLIWLQGDALTKETAGTQATHDCASRIAAILAASRAGKAGFADANGLQTIKGGDMAVLVSNHTQAAAMAQVLSAHGVPSVLRSKHSVWHSDEAKELLAVLLAYTQPAREGLLRYALLTRLLGRSGEEATRWQEDESAFEREQLAATVHQQNFHRPGGLMRALRSWLVAEGVAERLLACEGGERRLTNLLHLFELLQHESLRRPSLSALLLWFASRLGEDEKTGEDAELRLESDAERVQIVTIHSAKGLEYPLVFCPFLWDGKLFAGNKPPEHLRCHDENGALLADFGSAAFAENKERARLEIFAEKLRLAYVAMTRARDGLWLYFGAVQVPSDAKKLPNEGLHSNALAWLLFGKTALAAAPLAQKNSPRLLAGEGLGERVRESAQTTANPFSALGTHLGGRKQDSLRAELDERLSTLPHSAVLELRSNAIDSARESRAKTPEKLHEPPANLHRRWRIGSFSGLTFGVHRDAPDRDSITAAAITEPGQGFFAFPRGARAGTCLHGILEDWARDKGKLRERVQQQLQAAAIDREQWTDITTSHLRKVLDTDLNGEGLRLSALAPAKRLPELGFCLPLAPLAAEKLQTILQDPRHGLPESLREAARSLDFETLQGFLKGFIDLTFEWNGRWYIADYKSNWLGSNPSAYQQDALQAAMAREHYYLQALIYLLALRRFLRARLGEAAGELVGGAFYLFLRGMPEQGCWFDRPQDSLLDALDSLFAGESR